MTKIDSILLYVKNPTASAAFYAKLLDLKPVETSPTFAMFMLPSGLGLGLWSRDDVTPTPVNAGVGASDIGFKVTDRAGVDAVHAEWQAKGATIVLAPADLDFGRSFVATDPDGHRLRVYALNECHPS